MSTPKERPYRVDLSRSEDGTAVVWATSAKEAERIAWEGYPVWEFSPGNFIGRPKATMLRGEDRRYNADYGYHEGDD